MIHDRPKEWVRAYKESTPCADCHKKFPAVCMDFDHVDDNKVDNISTMVKENRPWLVIVEEISKCELVCANCHRIRTAERLVDSDTIQVDFFPEV